MQNDTGKETIHPNPDNATPQLIYDINHNMRLWVFGEAIRNWQKVVFYVDAKDYQSYIDKQCFQTITQIKLDIVQDNCYELLKKESDKTLVQAIYSLLSEWALFSN